MLYKGNDLDLRPAYSPAGNHSQAANPGAAPIAVDDLVLACCNGAYDVARFHASPEVRLEHLLHALTRVAAAADMLAALGIGTDQLRRETAVAIAAAMPAGPLEGAQAPVASAAFEDVLRRAAELASARRVSASVHDLLRSMLRGGPESPAASLLKQAAADAHQLARWRDETLARPPSASDANAPAQPMPADAANALHARLDQVEASVRALGAQAAADRKIIVESLTAMRGELQAMRAAREPASPAQQIAGLDATLDAKLGEFGQSLTARFASIDKLAAGGTWQPLLDRVESIEGQLGDQNGEVAKKLAITLSQTVSNALSARLDQSEAAAKRLRDELERLSTATGERQIALEASIRAQLQGAEEAGKAHERDLAEIYEALVKLGTNQQTLGDNLGTWRVESSGDIGIIGNRLQQMEQTTLDLLTRLGDNVAALRPAGGEDAGRRSNGFKRWLYGTTGVLGAGSVRPAADHPRGEDKS